MASVFVFKPVFLKEERLIFIFLFALLIIQTIYALVRYGKITSFHTYFGKNCSRFARKFFHFTFFSTGASVSTFLHCGNSYGH